MDQTYRTLKGYELLDPKTLTYAMEDYLEMIYRYCDSQYSIKNHQLAELLHVKPSSSSKMIKQLDELGYIEHKKYDKITLTPMGIQVASYLIERHQTINYLLCMINHSDNEIDLTEKIEHYFDIDTIHHLKIFLESLTKKTK